MKNNDTIKTTQVLAKNLKKGQKLLSQTNRVLTITEVKNTEKKTILILDKDMEIDFNPYTQLPVIT
jgi:hypothetical protein